MKDSMTMRRWFKRLATPPLLVVAVALVLFEEYLWEWLTGLMARLGRLPVIRELEARVAALPPNGALAVFLLPAVVLFPFKLAAVWAIATGHLLLGLLVLVTAKLAATALLARLYVLCEPALMRVAWFVRIHHWVMRVKAWAHDRLESWPAWRMARQSLHRATQSIRQAGLLTRRWRSIRRRVGPAGH
jgi:predicted membrane-bound spermidine synthase